MGDQKHQANSDSESAEPVPGQPGVSEPASTGAGEQNPPIRGTGVRMRLLLAAAEVFARKGYSAASVNEIVEAAGVTKPVLYYYFQNKEGIFHAILEDTATQIMNTLQASRQDQGNITARISRILASLFALCAENVQVVRLMYALHYGPPQGAPEHDIEIFHHRIEEIIKALVQEGIEAGELADWDAQEITWAILGIFDTAMDLTLCHPEVGFNQEKMTRLLQILYRGLSPASHNSQGEQQ
jgi:TetR/AcrR family transcriptional regulator